MNPDSIIRRLDIPSAILHGGGARHQLPALIKELNRSRPLIITDQGMTQLGTPTEIATLLKNANLQVAIFDQVQPDPTDLNIAAGLAALTAHNADILIALGGGSPIDAAKVIAVRNANPGPLADYMGLHKITNPGLPLIALPTTSGTGSEATKVAVITDTTRSVKMMMLSAPLLPTAAVVDFELTLSMPASLTAAVGVDTLTHGIEAYVSKKANLLTDPLALQCISLTSKHLQIAWSEPQNREAREAMMLAATLGGMAFSNSSVCLVHGMSRPIGAVFHVPHGLSNAVLLPTVTAYSLPAAIDRYATIARTITCATHNQSDTDAANTLIPWLENLNRSLNLPRLSGCRGVTKNLFDQSVQKMAADALASGSPANNPKIPTPEEIVTLYHQAW